MKLIPGPPPEGFVDSIATTYSNVAAQREEMGEAEWRWPIAERVLRQLLAERKTRLTLMARLPPGPDGPVPFRDRMKGLLAFHRRVPQRTWRPLTTG